MTLSYSEFGNVFRVSLDPTFEQVQDVQDLSDVAVNNAP
jgi:hypothetical protein